jgi:hypothetical protein
MLHRIDKALARPDHSILIAWEDGTTSVVSLADLVARGGVCAPMRDPRFFVEKMVVGESGLSLNWPDDVDFSADSLWYRAHPEDVERDLVPHSTERK